MTDPNQKLRSPRFSLFAALVAMTMACAWLGLGSFIFDGNVPFGFYFAIPFFFLFLLFEIWALFWGPKIAREIAVVLLLVAFLTVVVG